ncbi:Gfo/Idh/MocA family oxidoreductase [Paenibacillus sp.]|uniref:Gfo/Idh/MocA family protein n=1 Tax=Paenibacillus sp. TaxID=58172 RepID=UPI002D554834|nr:Gfo/Idh/MocA family oxidoreductase [Paenibacillus sp.]HZG86294.1 Gfo/Idh/MocA family oxidoreductase [Paenibacillus sp.]
MKSFGIGIIGLGGMANAHINGLRNIAGMRVAAICDVDAAALERIGERLGIPADKRFADYGRLIEEADVDAVISVTPNVVHADIMERCLKARKPFLSEKPFTMNFEEAERLKALYDQAPVSAMIGFSYRYTPAFRYARELLRRGDIGDVRSFFVQYLQGWGSAAYRQPFVWRFDKAVTGTGTLGDLGAHMIDLAHYLVGSFRDVSAQLATFIPERNLPNSEELVPVAVDDFASFQARMANGAAGVFQTSRNCIGSGNQLEISLYGDKGTLHASTLRPDQVVLVRVDDDTGELAEMRANVPQRAKLTQWEDFARMLNGEPSEGLPDFAAGFENQKVLEAILQANETKRTVSCE